jgi:hypothetical protein
MLHFLLIKLQHAPPYVNMDISLELEEMKHSLFPYLVYPSSSTTKIRPDQPDSSRIDDRVEDDDGGPVFHAELLEIIKDVLWDSKEGKRQLYISLLIMVPLGFIHWPVAMTFACFLGYQVAMWLHAKCEVRSYRRATGMLWDLLTTTVPDEWLSVLNRPDDAEAIGGGLYHVPHQWLAQIKRLKFWALFLLWVIAGSQGYSQYSTVQNCADRRTTPIDEVMFFVANIVYMLTLVVVDFEMVVSRGPPSTGEDNLIDMVVQNARYGDLRIMQVQTLKRRTKDSFLTIVVRIFSIPKLIT